MEHKHNLYILSHQRVYQSIRFPRSEMWGFCKLIQRNYEHNSALLAGHTKTHWKLCLGSGGDQTHDPSHADCNRIALILPAIIPTMPPSSVQNSNKNDALYAMDTNDLMKGQKVYLAMPMIFACCFLKLTHRHYVHNSALTTGHNQHFP